MLEVKDKQLQIGIFETSPQNRSILEFFFKNAGKSVFKEALLDECSAVIVDYDYPGAKENWEESYKLTQKPGIIISIKEIDLPSTIWVSKPISSQALLEAGIKLQELLDENKSIQEESPEIEITSNSAENEIIEKASETAISYDISIEEFNTEPEIVEIIDEPKEDATALLDNFKLDNTEFENGNVKDLDLTESISEHELFNADAEDSDSIIDDMLNIETIEDITTEETKDKNEASSEQNSDEGIIAVDSSDLEIFLDDNILQSDNLDNEPEVIEPSLEIETKEENTPPPGEVDSLLESLIEQNDEEASQIELIDVEEHNSIIMAEEEETLPAELAELSMAYEDSDTSKPVIIHEGSSIELNSISEVTNTTLSPEDELQALLDEIRQEAEASQVINKKPARASNSEARTNYIPSAAEDRWTYTCGSNLVFTKKNIEKTTFHLNNHLLFLLTDTIEVSRESEAMMRIKYQDHDIVICTSKEVVYCDSSIFSEEYAEMCFEPITGDDIKVHSLDKSEVRMYRTKMKNEPENAHSIESFMWTTGLVTSRGRITSETDMDLPVSLKHWPDITRLEVIPNAMRISAVFAKHPGSLKDLIKWLRVEQRYVLAFYNAALALNLIEFDQDNFSSPTTSKTNTKNRGFFSRLLNRIKS